MSTRTKITALPALLLLAAVTMPLGCAVGPQPTQMYGTKDLPKDWLALQGSDWRLDVLTPSTREYLQRVRENMSTERTGAEYRFYGRYSDATMKQMAEANEFASRVACTVKPGSSTVIFESAPRQIRRQASTETSTQHCLCCAQQLWISMTTTRPRTSVA